MKNDAKFESWSLWSIWPAALKNISDVLANTGPYVVHEADMQPLQVEQQGDTAVIPMRGPMTKRAGFITWLFGGTSTLELTAAIANAARDEDVKEIVILVDSPGGSVDGLTELVDTVKAAAATKPVIARVEGMAASAALQAISHATRIEAGRMDMIGSIGTRLMLLDSSEFFEKQGLKAIAIDTGEFKSGGIPGLEITEEQIAHFQHIVDGFFNDFVKSLSKGRGMTEAKVREIADGRMFFAEEAKANGLIDTIRKVDSSFHKPERQRRRRMRSAVVEAERLKLQRKKNLIT